MANQKNNKSLKKLKIISSNVNSIVSNCKRDALRRLIAVHDPEILLLNETKLNEKHTIFYKNYHCLRSDRPNANNGGGTAILIKKSIKFSTINYINTKSVIEKTIICIDLRDNHKLFLIAIYATRGWNKDFIPELRKIFEGLKLDNSSNFYFIAGDLNARHYRWNNESCNDRGYRCVDG